MDKIAEFVIALFQGLRLPFRWVAVILIITFSVLILFGYERATGHFYFSRLEQKISLLKELQNLKSSGIEQNPELYTIYQDEVEELRVFDVNHSTAFELVSIKWTDTTTVGKAVSGAFIWILFLFFGIGSEIKKDRKITGSTVGLTIFLLFISGLFAWLGVVIPTIINPWVNYILFPTVQIFLLILLTRNSIKKSATSQKPQ